MVQINFIWNPLFDRSSGPYTLESSSTTYSNSSMATCFHHHSDDLRKSSGWNFICARDKRENCIPHSTSAAGKKWLRMTTQKIKDKHTKTIICIRGTTFNHLLTYLVFEKLRQNHRAYFTRRYGLVFSCWTLTWQAKKMGRSQATEATCD